MNEWLQTLNELMRRLLFLPEQASTFATRVDRLHYFVFMVTMVSSVGIGLAAVYFFYRYRERTKNASTPMVVPSVRFESVVIAIPLFLFLVWVFVGFKDYIWYTNPPKGAMDVYVTGKKWMWHFAYPDGPNANATLTVPARRPVRLLMTSRDVIHSFYVPEFRIKQDVIPGRYTETWFEATKAGRYRIYCTEYCGTWHSQMVGEVVVLEPARVRRLAGPPEAGPDRPDRHQRRRRVRPGDLPRRPGHPRPAAGGGARLLQVPLHRRVAAHRPHLDRPLPAPDHAAERRRPSSPTRAT